MRLATRGTVARRRTVPTPGYYPGLRFFPTVGIQLAPGVTTDAAYLDAQYAALMKPAYHGDGSVKFSVRADLTWRRWLQDHPATPSLAEMRNPHWIGYAWNHGSIDLLDMYNAARVLDGSAKVSMQLQVSAGASNDLGCPQFMVDNGWAWVGALSKPRIKFYDTTARQYVENFFLAGLEKMAANQNFGVLKLAEYYPDAVQPSDYNAVGYRAGYRDMLYNVVAGAPTDASGNRPVIVQSNPIITSTGLKITAC